MIYEQAFYNLPEILVGSNYPEHDFETGISGAFAMAVLQELNGRNINNPISHIRLEHRYLVPDGVNPRAVRADMFLRTQAIGVANKALEAYGWRFQNYLEAKYIRGQNKQTIARGELAIDLVRLCCFARNKKGPLDSIGRYLLHVYAELPQNLMGGKLTNAGNKRKGYKEWIELIRTPGVIEINGIQPGLDGAKGVSRSFPGEISALKLDLKVRNLEISPRRVDAVRQYWCYLTRIESFKLTIGDDWFELGADRSIAEGSEGARGKIWGLVYRHLEPGATADGGTGDAEPGDADIADGSEEVPNVAIAV